MSGVAVGFGLMSWALRSEDSSVKAVGTFVKVSGSEYLEVVFALREVCLSRQLKHAINLPSVQTISQAAPIWNTRTTISHKFSESVNVMNHLQPNAVASVRVASFAAFMRISHSPVVVYNNDILSVILARATPPCQSYPTPAFFLTFCDGINSENPTGSF
jgi:hypothetical protein